MTKRFLVLLSTVLLASTTLLAQAPAPNPSADVVVANENLIVDGIPPVPASIAEKASRYTEFRSAGILDWHPTKREMLITTRFADVPSIHRVAMPLGARTQLTFFPDRTTSASYQPHKGDYFIFGKDIGGGEWFQIFRYDIANGDITMLTDGKSRNLGPVWSNAGDRIVYTSTRRNRADLDFYVMNPADKSTDKLLVQNEGGGWEIADWSPDDKTLLIDNGISVNESYLYTLDVATGARKELTPKSAEKVAWSPIGFSRDGKGIYVTTDKDNEFQRLAHMDLATRKITYLTNYNWDVDTARLSWDRKMIAFVLNENGMSTLHVLDLATNKERTLPKLPVGVIGNVQWHENNRDLAFALSSSRSPNDVYSVDLTTNKLDRWTASETAGLNPDNFVQAQLIKWKSFDGKDISGWLYQPDPKKFPGKRPVMIDIHGGPEGQDRPDFLGRYNYYVSELGVALIFPNIRGSLGYGKTFSMLDNGFKRGDSYRDIEELLKWTKQQPGLNGDKILITGGSYGGHMTLAIATHYNDMICCSVDVVGMSNLVTFLEHTEAYRRDLRRVEYGDERDPKMREYLESIAPMNKVKNITKPMFVVQGANDPRVPMSEADQMVKALKTNGTPVWYLVGKNEGHGFGKKKNADFQFYSTILFIRTHLLGEAAPAAGAGAK
jgi:dipeptidyl aminopeptidase/acylaminoacyl peptidase